MKILVNEYPKDCNECLFHHHCEKQEFILYPQCLQCSLLSADEFLQDAMRGFLVDSRNVEDID